MEFPSFFIRRDDPCPRRIFLYGLFPFHGPLLFLACFLAAAGLSVYAVFAHFRYYIYREQAILYIAEGRGEPYPVDLNECKIKGVAGAEKGFAGNRLLVLYRGEEIFFYVNKALIKDLLEYDASLFPLYSGKGNRAYANYSIPTAASPVPSPAG